MAEHENTLFLSSKLKMQLTENFSELHFQIEAESKLSEVTIAP